MAAFILFYFILDVRTTLVKAYVDLGIFLPVTLVFQVEQSFQLNFGIKTPCGNGDLQF